MASSGRACMKIQALERSIECKPEKYQEQELGQGGFSAQAMRHKQSVEIHR